MSLLKRKEPPPKPESLVQRERKAELVEPIRLGRQRVNIDALTMEEAAEMRDLHRKARAATDEGLVRDDLEALAERERKRFRQLLDQCLPEADRETRRLVRERREARALQTFADELANEGVPPARRLGLKAGEVVLPPDVVELDSLHVADVGVLVVVLHGWTSGRVPFREAHWSDDGTTLRLPKRVRFAGDELNRTYGRDGLPTNVVDIPRTLEHLARNGFLEIERDSAGWTVRLGPRLFGYIEGAA